MQEFVSTGFRPVPGECEARKPIATSWRPPWIKWELKLVSVEKCLPRLQKALSGGRSLHWGILPVAGSRAGAMEGLTGQCDLTPAGDFDETGIQVNETGSAGKPSQWCSGFLNSKGQTVCPGLFTALTAVGALWPDCPYRWERTA